MTLHHLTRITSSTVQSKRKTLISTSNSTVKRSHGVNVQNLIQKIENHPQRQAFQSDFQLFDVEPKTQCKVCLAYWDVGIVYCTCGYFLRDDTTQNQKCIKIVFDLFSIPNFYIRKGRPHGHRYGKKEGDQEYHTANQLQKKCKKRQFLSIHDVYS